MKARYSITVSKSAHGYYVVRAHYRSTGESVVCFCSVSFDEASQAAYFYRQTCNRA